MEDRHLLEAAAKAAGLTLTWEGDNPPYPRATTDGHWNPCWNPLTSDGDALRLAVKLRLDIYCHEAGALVSDERGNGFEENSRRDDPVAGARRAIVRAAAAMSGQG